MNSLTPQESKFDALPEAKKDIVLNFVSMTNIDNIDTAVDLLQMCDFDQ